MMYATKGTFVKIAMTTNKLILVFREMLPLPDGGQISVDWTPPLAQKPLDNTPTLVCLHGLTGGSHESYIRGLLEVVCVSRIKERHVIMLLFGYPGYPAPF